MITQAVRDANNSQAPILEDRHKASVRRDPVTYVALLAVLFVTLVQAGCVGLTSAKTSATSSDSTATGTISASPASLVFGNVTVGSTSKQNVTVTNSGSITVTLSQIIASGSGLSVTSPALPMTLSSGQSTVLTASLTPTTAGSVSGSVSISSSELSAPAAIPATGMGVDQAPAITTQPANQSITAGQTATFSVVATGTAPLSYQWQLNGTAISGANASSYTTPAEAIGSSGSKFSVVVSNSANSVTSTSATLTVNTAAVAPAITTQPASQTITAGQTATFSVVATGTAPLSYQWQLNGSPISGANASSYTTPAEAVGSSGAKFSVVVTNSVNSVTSGNATLTVNGVAGALSPSTSSLGFGNVAVNANSSMSVILTNAGSTSITITGVSMSGAGFSPSSTNKVSSGLIINGGSTATLSVTFAPLASGLVNGSVTITSTATNPSLVIGLSGTGVQTTSHSVTLSWTASTSVVTGYDVLRSTVSGGSYTQLNTSQVTTTQYTDSTAQSGQTYFYVVTAINSSGVQSTDSNRVTTVIP